MNTLSPFVSMVVSLTGCAILSLGMVLQKGHVGWLPADKGGASPVGKVDGEAMRVPAVQRTSRIRDILLWNLGFVLMNIQPIFSYIALLGLPANVVSAIAGSSVAFTAIFSSLILGERMDGRKIGWTVALFISIAVAGLRGTSGSRTVNDTALYIAFAIPFVSAILIMVFDKRLSSETTVIALAAAAGSLGGFMVLPMQGLQTLSEPGFAAWLYSPYLYIYAGAGIASFALNQVAYRRGTMTTIAPVFYGMQVLWPALASYAVTGAAFDLLQALAFAGIAGSILLISGKHR